MKQLIHLLSFLLVLALSSCNSGTALKYNQSLLGIEKVLEKEIVWTEGKCASFIQDDKYDSLVVVASRMEGLVSKAAQEVEELPTPNAKGVETFKKEFIKYFLALKSVYTSYKKYGMASTPEARDAEMRKLQETAEKTKDVIKNIQAVQKRFASDNGFKIK